MRCGHKDKDALMDKVRHIEHNHRNAVIEGGKCRSSNSAKSCS
jgi:hypothetical protein